MNLEETEAGVIVKVFVKPRSVRFNVTVDDGEIVVFCTERPVKGKVNKELVKQFSRLFHAKVEFISGLTS